MCISFISSRRRHTRCGRDWSSDVCSSDLKDWGVNNIRAVKADVFKVIKKINQSFDIIFADPPYNNPQYPELPDMIFESGWMKKGGLLILEHGDEHNFESNPRFNSHRNYGDVNFSFFRD